MSEQESQAQVKRAATFPESVNFKRQDIKHLAEIVLTLKTSRDKAEVAEQENRPEVMANLTLAYRHLEDASMRLGKVLQAFDGGVSVYDKNTTVGA